MLPRAATGGPLSLTLKPVRVLRGARALLFHGGLLYLARGTRLLRTDDLGRTLHHDCTLQIHSPRLRLAGATRLGRRLTRASISRLTILPDLTRLLVYRKGIYRVTADSQTAARVRHITRGTRPVSLASAPSGFACFGEYFNNPERVEVHIYGSADSGLSWHPVYTFPAGAIKHVHAIAYDRWSDCFWIATGDCPGECRLLHASSDFGDVREVLRGDQESRFYRLLPTPDSLVTATDTPYAANAITVIDKATGRLHRVQEAENSCFGVCQVGSRFFVATTAEPGGENDTRHAHIWAGAEDLSTWQRCASLPIDAISSMCLLSPRLYGLMQFPRAEFPEGPNPNARYLVAYCTGLRSLDDTTIVYEIDAAQGSEIR
jgi:hypothetical protein